jgi:hypothetical protein
LEKIRELPVLGALIRIFDTYPRISMWVVLSTGIIVLLVYEARDVGLTTGNWIALILASIVVAGLCIWIVSWEDEEEGFDDTVRVKSTKTGEAPAVDVSKE